MDPFGQQNNTAAGRFIILPDRWYVSIQVFLSPRPLARMVAKGDVAGSPELSPPTRGCHSPVPSLPVHKGSISSVRVIQGRRSVVRSGTD